MGAIALLGASGVSGFAVNPKLQARSSKSTKLFGIRCENKYYQLEELEDKDNCTTELFLTEDGQVEVGKTDGPVWTGAIGRWAVIPGSNNFKMGITRRYSGGQGNTDMGEFSYELHRTFTGEMTSVGDSVGITGVMTSHDAYGNDSIEVGFFNMIDGTDVRMDRRPDARTGVSQS
ncbi:expressed unknown protein [Seminavis robusta]|uniref:Uncharacterized protein n=1 Tax=Seminavis robusta TaxID=568900 RepID=A0A9N8H3W4_9STRA|nr:expressed unknown protein [Seminavis robusta]|eukprot:Sro70_g039150.1 n/a (175) ;mRNA; f:120497-121207